MERQQHLPISSPHGSFSLPLEAENFFRVQWANKDKQVCGAASSAHNNNNNNIILKNQNDDDTFTSSAETKFLQLSQRRRNSNSFSKSDHFWDSCDRYLSETAVTAAVRNNLKNEQQHDNDVDTVKAQQGAINPPPLPPLPPPLPLDLDVFQPNDFRLLKKLGQGGYGCVYKAIHTSTGYVVALKELTGAVSDVEILDHRKMPWDCGMVPCYGTFRAFSNFLQEEDDDNDDDDDDDKKKNIRTAVTTKETRALAQDKTRLKTWLILKFCPGGSLVDRLLQQQQVNNSDDKRGQQQGVLSEREAARMIKRIVKTLLFLKEQYGIVHNDIKPANLLDDGNGGYYLCDLGAAKKGLWQKERVGGTYSYMPPEKLRARKLAGLLTHYCNHEKHDVWSLGVTLFVSIFARHPFNAKAIAKCTTITSSGHDASRFYDLMETNYNNIQYPNANPKNTTTNGGTAMTTSISKGLKDVLEGMLTPFCLERLTLSCVKEHSWVQRNGSSKWWSHTKHFVRENLLLSSAVCSAAMACKSFTAAASTTAAPTHVTQDQAFLKVLCQEPTVTMDGSEEDPPAPPPTPLVPVPVRPDQPSPVASSDQSYSKQSTSKVLTNVEGTC